MKGRYAIIGANALRIYGKKEAVLELGLSFLEYGQRNMRYTTYPKGMAALFVPAHDVRVLRHFIAASVLNVNVWDQHYDRPEVACVIMPAIETVPFTLEHITYLPLCDTPIDARVRASLIRAAHAKHVVNKRSFWYRIIDTQGFLADALEKHGFVYSSVAIGNGNRVTYAILRATTTIKTLKQAGWHVQLMSKKTRQSTYLRHQQIAAIFPPLADYTDEKITYSIEEDSTKGNGESNSQSNGQSNTN